MVPYPSHEGTQTGPRVEFIALVFGQIYVFESYSDETATWTGTEGVAAWPIYPIEKPTIDPFELMKAVDREWREENQAQRRELHFKEPKSLKPSTRLKTPLFSRRLEGGRAQRHRQKWKTRRQKVGLT